jgi:PAS domain S-box-containing protein
MSRTGQALASVLLEQEETLLEVAALGAPPEARQACHSAGKNVLEEAAAVLAGEQPAAAGRLATAVTALEHSALKLPDMLRLMHALQVAAMGRLLDHGGVSGPELSPCLEIVGRVFGAVVDRLCEMNERRLRGEQEELLQTVGNMRVAVFRAAADSTLVVVNQAGAELLGASRPEEVIGRRFAEFYADPQERWAIREQLMATGKVMGARFRAVRPDEQTAWMETNVVARFSASGELTGFEGFAREVTDLVSAEEEVRKLNQFLKVVIDNATVWLDVLDEKAQVIIWNKAAESISGYSRSEVIGHDQVWEWLYPDECYRQEITARAHRIIHGDEVRDLETAIRTKSGQSRTIAWDSRNLTDGQSNTIGSVALGRDVTEEKALRERLAEQDRGHVAELERQVRERTTELERANRELQMHDKMKDTFLANISHELRTPLVSGLGYVDLILSGGLGGVSERAKKGLRISRQNLQRLVGLIDDLLSFTQKSLFRDTLHLAPFDLEPLVSRCVAEIRGTMRASTRLRLDIPDDLPPIRGDEEQIHRVLINLLNNAEKFSGDDAEIEVRAHRISADRAEVVVLDNGIGIPAPERELVFDRLYRSSITDPGVYRGTGIGLSLVKEILGLHGCTVRAEGRRGPGTAIVFTLPLEA